MAKTTKKKVAKKGGPPANETPEQAFKRLATNRTNRAVKAVGLIGQLTGPAYASTDVERRAIVQALQASVDTVKDVFEGKAKSSDTFKLPS